MLQRAPVERRCPILVAFVHHTLIDVTDGIIELYDRCLAAACAQARRDEETLTAAITRLVNYHHRQPPSGLPLRRGGAACDRIGDHVRWTVVNRSVGRDPSPTRLGVCECRLELSRDRWADVLSLPDARGEHLSFWSSADDAEQVAGFGAAQVVVAAGDQRLAQVSERCRAISTSVARVGDESGGPGPAWLGGFAFLPDTGDDELWVDFPPAMFTLPAVQVRWRPDGTWLTVAAPLAALDALSRRVEQLRRALEARPGGVSQATAAATSTAGRRRPPTAGTSTVGRRQRPAAGTPAVGRDRPAAAAPVGPSELDRIRLQEDVRRMVRQALGEIRAGRVAKVVISTAQTLRSAAPVDPVVLLGTLIARQPSCYHFLVSPAPGVALVGASPERLVRLTGRRLQTMALAGSAPRGHDEATDRALARALLSSAKERAEHQLVVAAIRDALGDLDLDVAPAPRVRRLAMIQHLETPIEAQLPERGDVLAWAGRLHPTPALGGVPRRLALGLIAQIEGTGRGWYGGAVGWLDGHGGGELAVTIRALLVRGELVTAFAGAGIVAGSSESAEAVEIELKIRSTLSAMLAAE